MCISTVYLLLAEIWRKLLSLVRRGYQYPLVVLTYHVVQEEDKKLFGRQMDALKKLAEPVSASFQGPLNDKVRRVAVTFDDGFKCIVENAFPQASERNIPITIFVPAGYLGKHPTWIPDTNHLYLSEMVMTSDELRCLPKERVSIGSHTVSHPDLCKVNNGLLDKELRDSKRQLQEILGREVNLLSFPFGSFDDRVMTYSRSVGFSRVFSNLPRISRRNDETFHMGRINADPSDWPFEFHLKIKGAYGWLLVAVGIKRWLKRLTSNGIV